MKRILGTAITAFLILAALSCGSPTQLFSSRERSQLFAVDLSLEAPLAAAAPEVAAEAPSGTPAPAEAPQATEAADGVEAEGAEQASPEPSPQAQPSPVPALSTPIFSGAVLSPGDRMGLRIRALSEDSTVEQAEFSLIRADLAVASSLFRAADLGLASLIDAPLSTSLPLGLPGGLYTVRLELRSGEASLYSNDTQVFILDRPFGITYVQSCPAHAQPSSLAVLEAELRGAEGLDPWLVWSRNGTVISSGRLSEGSGQLLWPTPAKEGVYGIDLSAYPEAPSDGVAFGFSAPASFRTSVIVEAAPADPYGPFARPQDFTALFSFDRDLSDGSGHLRASDLSVTGSPNVRIYGAGYGYALGPDAALAGRGAIFPIAEGAPAPFTIALRASPLASSGTLFTAASDDGASSVSLEVAPEGEVVLAISAPGGRAVSRSGIFLNNRFLDLAVSVQPWADGYALAWYRDGKPRSSSRVELDAAGFPRILRFSLGGPGSLAAVYDEFGVYSAGPDGGRDVWSTAFLASSLKEFGEALLMAEGFDAVAPPSAGVTLSRTAAKEPGAVLLPPGASLSFRPDGDWGDGIKVEAAFVPDADAGGRPVVSLRIGGAPLLSIQPDGKVLLADGKLAATLPPFPAASASFTLSRDQGGIRIGSGKGKVRIALDAGAGALGLSISPDGSGSLRVDSLRVLRWSEAEGLTALRSLPPSRG